MRQLEGELGRSPNQAELAKALALSIEELQAHQNEASAKTIFSLSEKWDDGEEEKEMEKVEILADKKCVDPLDTIQQRDALELITRNLTKKERLIILMYYYEDTTYRELATSLGVSAATMDSSARLTFAASILEPAIAKTGARVFLAAVLQVHQKQCTALYQFFNFSCQFVNR
jgi:DNA-directed RNA polymerase specialized sigma subunit